MISEDPKETSRTDRNSAGESVKDSIDTSEQKSSSWDWIWPTIAAVVIVKLFGLVGGLATIGSYFWLKPKLGTWGAVGASALIGIVVAVGILSMIR